MPITGLPNARVHRLCRRCQQWHQPWEGHYEWPRVTGPFTWLRITIARQVEDDTVMVWVCDGCKVEHHAARQPLADWVKPLLGVMVVIVIGLAVWLMRADLFSMFGLDPFGS